MSYGGVLDGLLCRMVGCWIDCCVVWWGVGWFIVSYGGVLDRLLCRMVGCWIDCCVVWWGVG